ncbi:MAG: FAD-binding protein, partial [Deltaproteobacteria bacterium]|nr:FAD-binding protein [Deltaproteobacteria bacterium]MBW2138286.1 FAD-binding protein [Deltaproteobacteria bacterium]
MRRDFVERKRVLIETDVLVIGTGAAGLRAAIEAK